jgi:hypothetical protein
MTVKQIVLLNPVGIPFTTIKGYWRSVLITMDTAYKYIRSCYSADWEAIKYHMDVLKATEDVMGDQRWRYGLNKLVLWTAHT